jgi:deazaflavin-dependent oxidoreductase (nitroreductase family)
MNPIGKLFVGAHASIYRLSGGRLGGKMGFPVLLLTTTGRKSGKKKTTPLGYFERDGGYIIVASNGGADTHPAWFLNLQANQAVTFQVMDNVMKAQAEIITDEKRKEIWKWVVKTAPSYGAYEKSTTREIPLVFLRKS